MIQEDLHLYFISEKLSFIDVVDAINKGGKKICFVVDNNNKLLGTITDGDIRRALLKGGCDNLLATDLMNVNFMAIEQEWDIEELTDLMISKKIDQIPVLNELGEVVDIKDLGRILNLPKNRTNMPAFIFAGGKGSRLQPLTKNCPKPMLKVNEKPLMEHILCKLVKSGFKEIYVSINYLREQIKEYFGNGEKFNCSIKYIEEETNLGTAGALQYLNNQVDSIFVINSDVFSNLRISSLIDFYNASSSDIVTCVKEVKTQIPFGAVKTISGNIVSIEEKPTMLHYVNTGMYVLSKNILKLISKNEKIDMPDLINRSIEQGFRAEIFPMHEKWLDVGRHENLTTLKNNIKDY